MCDQNLEIIKTRTIFLENGNPSEDVVLVDKEGDGDMYFTFSLKYVEDVESSSTHYHIEDKHRASFIIETKPNASTKLAKPFLIGTYGKENKDLYINISVQPKDANNMHSATITFLTSK